MNHSPIISIVLCTYNNADSLRITLNQLISQREADGKIEIIVVNNNASDHTADVCNAIAPSSKFPFHYMFEARQGLSHARNTGVENATGQYVLFTDDDAELPNDWAAQYLKTIESKKADCLYSSIAVIWDQPRPWWYLDAYKACFVELNYGLDILEITDIHHEFFGKNFCVKKDLIIQQGGFDPALGRNGSKLIAGEETLLYRSLIHNNARVIYFPSAPVGHRLKPKEYTPEHITKLFIDGAYSSLHIAKVSKNKKIGGRPLGLLLASTKTLINAVIAYFFSFASAKNIRFYHNLRIKKSLTTITLWVKN
ncbi:MAG TPA: glycosyltransferase family A protein [Cellvibrio sp.]|nr:glycosyltransferase family A protein [Cellvibrio sp.]